MIFSFLANRFASKGSGFFDVEKIEVKLAPVNGSAENSRLRCLIQYKFRCF